MKFKNIGFAAVFAGIAFATATQAATFNVLSECRQYPDFDPLAITHNDFGPSVYGTWSYDLHYRNVQTVLIEDQFGRVQCSEATTRSQILSQRFEISDQYGLASDIATSVRAWLASHAIDRCAP